MKDFDFIEIGTSNFDTLIQKASSETIGISIEPIKKYLDDLPDKPNCIKFNGAISNVSGMIDVYYVPKEDIIKYDLPDWVIGCNSVNKYHPTVDKLLKAKGLVSKDIICKETIPVLTFSDLVSRFNVKSCKHLKIDTEGHDITILKSYIEFCEQNENFICTEILFESNVLSNKKEVSLMIEKLKSVGYKLIYSNHDTLMRK